MQKDYRISEKEFGLSLNLDDTNKALTPGDSRYILNCVAGINKEGNIGAIENEKGNELISVILPDGVNTCLGSAVDEQRNAIYYFLHNNQDDHSIIRYNINTNNTSYILKAEPVLNFFRYETQGYITHAHVINDLLFWVDGVNEARKINVEKARLFTKGNLTDGYSEITEEVITAMKKPPILSPVLRSVTEPSRATNFIRQKAFQFAYRYVYDDLEKSVFSPWSRALFQPWDPSLADDIQFKVRKSDYSGYTDRGINYNFPFGSFATSYNSIDVRIYTGGKTVTFIEVAVRDSIIDDWNLIETIDNQEKLKTLAVGASFSFSFYNDKTGRTISDLSIIKSQDFFPIAPKCQTYSYLNLLVYSNYEDGYDLEDVDLSLSFTATEFNQMPWAFNELIPRNNSFFQFRITPISTADYREMVFPSIAIREEGDLIGVMTQYPTNTDLVIPVGWYRFNDADIIDQEVFNKNFLDALSSQGWRVERVEGQQKFRQYNGSASQDSNDDIRGLYVYSKSDFNVPTFKSGAFHQVGIQYLDRWGRRGPGQTNDKAKIYIPTWGEYNDQNNIEENPVHGYSYQIKVEINHTPPVWAHSYQIVYSGALNIADFLQYLYRNANSVDVDGLNPVKMRGRIDFSSWADNYKTTNERVERGYLFEVGDSVREVKRGTIYGTDLVAKMSNNNKSEEITSINPVNDNLIAENLFHEVPTSLGSFFNSVFNPSDAVSKSYNVSGSQSITSSPHTIMNLDIVTLFSPPAEISWAFTLITANYLNVGANEFGKYEVDIYFAGNLIKTITNIELKGKEFLNGTKFLDREIISGKEPIPSTFMPNISTDKIKIDVRTIIESSGFKGIEVHFAGVQASITQTGISATSLIEQYKTQEQSEFIIFKEIGKTYLITEAGTPNRRHAGDVNQVLGLTGSPAEVNLDRGDAWVRLRVYDDVRFEYRPSGESLTYPYQHCIEDPNNSDYYSSGYKGYGRPVAENPDYKRTSEITGLRHTNSFIEGTKTNQLNEIDLTSVEYVSQTNGAIIATREVGYTLKVIQERRLTSIYMGRQTTTNPEGTQNLILSDRVFASINPSDLDYGTRHPESVVKHDRNLYFFDVNYGKVIRDSANGMISVSDYKLSSIFRDLADTIYARGLTKVFCYGSWNDDIGSYIFSFLNGRPNADFEGPAPGLPGHIGPVGPIGGPIGDPILDTEYLIRNSETTTFVNVANIALKSEIRAIDRLITNLKTGISFASDLWGGPLLNAIIYPFVGGTDTSNKYNLRDTTNGTLTFVGSGLVHSSNGMTTDGVSYADTGLTPALAVGSSDASLGVYLLDDNTASNNIPMGAQDSTSSRFYIQAYQGTGLLRVTLFDVTGGLLSSPVSGSKGFSFASLFEGQGEVVKDGGSLDIGPISGGTIPSVQTIYIGGRNNAGLFDSGIINTIQFAFVGGPMTSNELVDMGLAVETFQADLERSAVNPTSSSTTSSTNKLITTSSFSSNNNAKVGSFTLSFQEISNRWKSYHSYQGEQMQFLAKEFISFVDGELWKHNSDNVPRMNFYGEQYDMVFEPISNMSPDVVKVFEAIAVQSNKIPLMVEAFIDGTDFYKSGMYSRILKVNFDAIEDNYYASVKKDLFSPIDGSDIYKLNNGRKMRGNTCKFRLTFNDVDKVVVTRLIVEIAESKVSG